MTPTPRPEHLIAFAAGDLPDAAVPAVEAAVARDPRLAAIVSAYRLVERVAASDDSVEPPAETVARGIAVFDPSKLPVRPSWRRTVERMIGRLILDSRDQPLALRYADGHDRYQLTFSANDHEVDVQVERPESRDDRWRVIGTIDERLGARSVAATPSGTLDPVAESGIDDGFFTLELEGGRYDLLVDLSERILVLPEIALE